MQPSERIGYKHPVGTCLCENSPVRHEWGAGHREYLQLPQTGQGGMFRENHPALRSQVQLRVCGGWKGRRTGGQSVGHALLENKHSFRLYRIFTGSRFRLFMNSIHFFHSFIGNFQVFISNFFLSLIRSLQESFRILTFFRIRTYLSRSIE